MLSGQAQLTLCLVVAIPAWQIPKKDTSHAHANHTLDRRYGPWTHPDALRLSAHADIWNDHPARRSHQPGLVYWVKPQGHDQIQATTTLESTDAALSPSL